jgi:hypothetical protein
MLFTYRGSRVLFGYPVLMKVTYETQQSTKPPILKFHSPDQKETEHIRGRIAWVTFPSSLLLLHTMDRLVNGNSLHIGFASQPVQPAFCIHCYKSTKGVLRKVGLDFTNTFALLLEGTLTQHWMSCRYALTSHQWHMTKWWTYFRLGSQAPLES